MPRDGSNIYHRPVGTDAVTDTSIESTKYNNFVADVEQDLNWPRPIVAGGTGATNAHDAMVALGGEVAKQFVTNYDTFPFVDGDFYSQPGATSAPPTGGAGYIAGVCYGTGLSAMMLEARDLSSSPSIKWTRCQTGGVWQPWKQENAGSLADTDARYVNVAGDTMTGLLNLQVAGGGPIGLYGTVGANNNDIASYKNSLVRWIVRLGDATAESGGDAGSNLQIYAFNDADTSARSALAIQRSDLTMSLGGPLNVSGAVYAQGPVYSAQGTTGHYYFGNAGSSLSYDGSQFVLNGGRLLTAGDIDCWGTVTAGGNGAGGVYYFGNSGSKYLTYDGTNFNLVGGTLYVGGGLTASGAGGNLTISSVDTRSGGATAGIAANFNGLGKPGVWFSNDLTKYLSYDGTNFSMAGGNLSVGGLITSNQGAAIGTFVFGSSGAKYLQFDGNQFNLNGGLLAVLSTLRVGTPNPSGLPENIFSFYNGAAQWGSLFSDPSGAPTSAACYFYKLGTGVGSIIINSSSTSYQTSSDLALKDVKGEYDVSEAVRIIRADPVRTWNWKSTGEVGVGWVAQYSHAVHPDLAGPPPAMAELKEGDRPEMSWGIDYGKRTPYLWAAVTSLLDRIDALEAKIAELEHAGTSQRRLR